MEEYTYNSVLKNIQLEQERRKIATQLAAALTQFCDIYRKDAPEETAKLAVTFTDALLKQLNSER